MTQCIGGTSQHVQAGPHAVGVVSQGVHPVLLGDNQGVLFSLVSRLANFFFFVADAAAKKLECLSWHVFQPSLIHTSREY